MRGIEYRMNTGQAYTVSRMRPGDAEEVVRLYRAVYGDAYPIQSVYDPDQIRAQDAGGDMYRVVARTPEGEIISQVAIYRSTPPNPLLYEEGQGMTLLQYRKQGIAEKCVKYIHEVLCPQLGLEQIWGEAVCNTINTQKLCAKVGYCETALEIDLMPAAAYEKEKSSKGRVSVLVLFKTYIKKPQTIYLPEIYADDLRYMYSVCDYGHTFVPAPSDLPVAGTTTAKVDLFDFARVARLTIKELGSEFEEFIPKKDTEVSSLGYEVVQVFLELSSPAVGGAVNILRKHGYFIGGPLPGWFGHDGLMMQKTANQPDFDAIKLYTERARKILEIIRNDREMVKRISQTDSL